MTFSCPNCGQHLAVDSRPPAEFWKKHDAGEFSK